MLHKSDIVPALVLLHSKAGGDDHVPLLNTSGDENVPQLSTSGDENVSQHQEATSNVAKQYMKLFVLTRLLRHLFQMRST